MHSQSPKDLLQNRVLVHCVNLLLFEFLCFQLEAKLAHGLECWGCGTMCCDGVQIFIYTHSIAEFLEAEHALWEKSGPLYPIRLLLEPSFFKILFCKYSRAIFEMLKVPWHQIIMQKVLPFLLLDVLNLLPEHEPLKWLKSCAHQFSCIFVINLRIHSISLPAFEYFGLGLLIVKPYSSLHQLHNTPILLGKDYPDFEIFYL